MGMGDWGLGIGDWAQSPIPNPQSPIPNPQFKYKSKIYNILKLIKYKKNNKILILHKNNNAIFLKITGFIKYFNNDKN